MSAELLFQKRVLSAHLEAIEEAKPFVDLIMQIKVFERPTYILKDFTLTMVSDGLTPEQRAIIRQCEAWIAEIHDRAIQRLKASMPTRG